MVSSVELSEISTDVYGIDNGCVCSNDFTIIYPTCHWTAKAELR